MTIHVKQTAQLKRLALVFGTVTLMWLPQIASAETTSAARKAYVASAAEQSDPVYQPRAQWRRQTANKRIGSGCLRTHLAKTYGPC